MNPPINRFSGRAFVPVVLLAALLEAASMHADVRNCACEISKPETLDSRECSLCKEVEKNPPDVPVVLLKDNNPRKANRWLALPRKHYPGAHDLSSMASADRTALWSAAIQKGKDLWGIEWGVAMNGELARTQCHGHVHIGRILDDVEYPGGVFVDDASQIPLPPVGTGIWVHQSGKRLHVHTGEQITESVLMR